MPKSKEKRTKEQVLKLLDQAIDQEELLLGKLQLLEAELAICRKKAENPRHELDEQALPKSKVSFRLDFYRTEDKGPLKGIIEHLSSRENCSFEGGKLDVIHGFITQFVGEPTWGPLPVNPTPFKEKGANTQNTRPNKPDKKKQQLGLSQTDASKASPNHPLPKDQTLEMQDDFCFFILTGGNSRQGRTIQQAQPFEIEIPLGGIKNLQGKPCNLKISAITPGKLSGRVFELEENCIPARKALRIPVPTHALESGVYQLWVSLALRAAPQNLEYHQCRLLIVL